VQFFEGRRTEPISTSPYAASTASHTCRIMAPGQAIYDVSNCTFLILSANSIAIFSLSRWGDYCGIGKLSPHNLRRTAITRALDHGLSYRQMQMISGYKDPKTVMRYDHNRENLDLNAVNHRAMTRRPRTGTAQKRRRRESVAARWIRWRTRMPRGWIFNASNRIIMTGKLAVRFI
jgi:integrase-like protein